MTYTSFSDFWTEGKQGQIGQIQLCQKNMGLGGGKISVSDIDRINQYKNTQRVEISGLRQDTFEYFITKYGNRIKYINFFKNKMIEDFSVLSTLTEVRGISFFHNQRATRLWDMSSNNKLEGLKFNNFTRLHSLDGIQTAPSLRYLSFGDILDGRSTLTDLEPLAGTKLVYFEFSGKRLESHDTSVYMRMPELKYLDFYSEIYTTEEIAQIVASCPHLSGRSLGPYVTFDRTIDGLDVRILGKRKPNLNSQKDAARIAMYAEKFYALVEQYKRSL